MLEEIILHDLPVPAQGVPLDAERYIADVRQAVARQKQVAVFPARVRITPIFYLPRPARREVALHAIPILLSALVGYVIAANDSAHVEEGGPILVELRADANPRMDAMVTPIAPLPGGLP